MGVRLRALGEPPAQCLTRWAVSFKGEVQATRTFQDPKLSQELKPTPIQKPTRQPAPRLRQGPAAKVGACRSAASLKHAAERFRFPLLSFQWILRKIPHHPAHHFRRPLAAGHLRKLVWKRNRNQNAKNGN